ncbi:MAG TPA: gliding motility-associated C-terminal domain-containing protein [Sphingobacteriaceae bacterium]
MKSIKNISFIISALVMLQGCKHDESLNPQNEDGIVKSGGIDQGGNISGAAGTIYFSQDFNSSTAIATYLTTATGTVANKFNLLSANGNATVDIVNNKLQIVKNGGSGINRAGFQRTTLPSGPANFLKYSMEVTVTGNTEGAIDNGFQFTVGDYPGSPVVAAPGDGAIHSILRVNPTANVGEFQIVTGSSTQQTSPVYSGTKTIIWYINNSGEPLGYVGPDGQPASVMDDHADVYVVSGTNVTIAIDEAPAVTAAKNLRGFKFASNPNWVATLDVDNIELKEEASIPVPVIASVAAPTPVTVPQKTNFDLRPLAKQLEVTYKNGTKEMVQVSWAPSAAGYNQYLLGTYTVLGTIIPNRGTINPDNLSVTTTVTVKNDIKIVNAFTPNNDGKNDTWINPDLKYYRVSSVEVFDRDGVRLFYSTDPNVGWDGRNQHGQIIAGPYSYVIKVPDLSMEKKGVVTVIK